PAERELRAHPAEAESGNARRGFLRHAAVLPHHAAAARRLALPAEHANAIQSRAVSPPGCRPRVRRPPPLRSARVRVRERAAGRRSLRRLGRSTQRAPRYTALSSPTSVMIRDVCCVVSGAKTRAV